MTTHAVRVQTITIDVPFQKAYEFTRQPQNFPRWAAGMSSSLQRTSEGWVAEAPQGKAMVRFSEPNDYGVLDHWVTIEGVPEIYIPLRMLVNGEGIEVELVLFRLPGMSDADFERDAEHVKKDLGSLKRLLEQQV